MSELIELVMVSVGCGHLRAGTRLQADLPRYNLQVPKVVSPQRLGLLPFARISHVCEIRQRKLEGRIKDRDDPGKGWRRVGWEGVGGHKRVAKLSRSSTVKNSMQILSSYT